MIGSRPRGSLSTCRSIVLASCALLIGCSVEPPPAGRSVIPVRSATVARQEYVVRHVVTGDVVAARESRPGFARGGTVLEVSVDVGDVVSAGDELARVDATLAQAERAAAQAAVRAAESRLQLARSESARQRALGEDGYASGAALDSASTGSDAAEAALASARAELAASEDALEQTVLLAPDDGVVTERLSEPGALARPGQPVLGIAVDGALQARFDVAEAVLLEDLALDSIRLELVRDRSVHASGRVQRVSPAVDPHSGTVRVWTTLEAASERLPLGAAVEGSLVSRARDVFLVPSTALDTLGDRPALWVIDPDTGVPAPRAVELLDHVDGRSIVTEGLQPGERIVVAPVNRLASGVAVEPIMAGTDR